MASGTRIITVRSSSVIKTKEEHKGTIGVI